MTIPETDSIHTDQATASVRTTQLMNTQWRFHKGHLEGAEVPDLDDTGWVDVDLPHTASMPYWNDVTEVWEGDTWYRKTFTAPADWNDLFVSIDFEGAFQHAWVYLNGELLAENIGGYTGFNVDMTPALRCGEENVLAVRVRNGWDAQIAPRAGDTIFMNGLNRNVRFVTTQAQHIEWFGQSFTTPKVSHGEAHLQVTTEIRNRNAESALCDILLQVMLSLTESQGL